MKGLSECSAQVDPTYKKMIEPQHDMSIMPVSAQPGRHREGMAHRVAMKGERQVGIQPTEFDRHCAQEYSTQKGWHRECKRRENYSNSRAAIRVWTLHRSSQPRRAACLDAVVKRIRQPRGGLICSC